MPHFDIHSFTFGLPDWFTHRRTQRSIRVDLSHNEIATALVAGDKNKLRALLADSDDIEQLLSQELEPTFCRPYVNVFYALCVNAPDVAKEQLDRIFAASGQCITGRHKLNYSFLDNIYIPNADSVQLSRMDSSASLLSADTWAKDPNNVHRFSNTLRTLISKHCLTFMAKHNQEALLKHPIVSRMVVLKSKPYQYFFYVGLLMWALFIASLMTIVSLQDHPYVKLRQMEKVENSGDCMSYNSSCCVQYRILFDKSKKNQHTLFVFQCIVAVILSLRFLAELYHLSMHRQYYFLSAERLTALLSYACVVFLLFGFYEHPVPIACYPDEVAHTISMHTKWSWEISVVGIALTWTNLLFFTRQMQGNGLYVIMFINLVARFVAFSFVMIVCVGAFGSVFFMLYQRTCPFQDYGWSTLASLVMMVGEYSFQGMVCEEGKAAEIHSVELLALAYVGIVFIMYFVVVNLMVGLAVHDITQMQSKAEFEKLKLLTSVLLDYEVSLPFGIVKKLLRFEETVSCADLGCNLRKSEMQAEAFQLAAMDQISQKLEKLTNLATMISERINAVEARISTISSEMEELRHTVAPDR